MDREADELVPGGHDGVLSIADLYDEIESTLVRTFPRRRELWVRGEIHHVADQTGRRGHCYLDLVDPDSAGERQAPVLRVKCWQSTWAPLRAALGREGISLAPGMVVLLRGSLDFFRPKAEIGFVLAELDVTALLGRLAAERAALLRALGAEGLLQRNRALAVPAVPLRIGLVASPGTEGCRDFLGQLESSGFAFSVQLAPVSVQGPAAPASIAAALVGLSARGPSELDVIVVVRGGGSKADLAAFDAEPVARAVATAAVPVWTGIGHTGDESVADLVANRACITPTECGRELAQRVGAWWESWVAAPAGVVARRSADAIAASQVGHDQARERLCAMARHLIDRRAEQLGARAGAVRRCAPRALEGARAGVAVRTGRLGPLSTGHLERAGDRLTGWRRLLAAYDVERQLERGYSLTLGPSGTVVRSAAQLRAGDAIVTRFADGHARSVVDAVGAGGDVSDGSVAAGSGMVGTRGGRDGA